MVFREGRAPLLGGFSFFSVSYPQTRRSYYLFFNYLFFNYLYGGPLSATVSAGRGSTFGDGERW